MYRLIVSNVKYLKQERPISWRLTIFINGYAASYQLRGSGVSAEWKKLPQFPKSTVILSANGLIFPNQAARDSDRSFEKSCLKIIFKRIKNR